MALCGLGGLPTVLGALLRTLGTMLRVCRALLPARNGAKAGLGMALWLLSVKVFGVKRVPTGRYWPLWAKNWGGWRASRSLGIVSVDR
ncbi:hypothetical protein VRU48_17515 [Pedobacter sp. KR3-3]|uniref:Uncharacterized protein n=1 Tax=Pedobacter albus TaxID=3113905 RepID=A0ABU7ICM7_9SPHI|nr:hypothetical protein [Pedobacter sp. KR3-3]MEE1946929.1 hypothetical protein [Pedobacter sp. KR3-3]